MTALSDLWSMVAVGYVTPAGVIALAQQHDTLATSLGYRRIATVREPSTWSTGTPATSAEVAAWENWYNGIAPVAGIPTTGALTETSATGSQWTTLREMAQQRATPTAVQAYFANASDAWNTMRASVLPGMLASNINPVVTDAERNLQAWWFRRLGGASGTPAPFVRGDGAPATPPANTTPANTTPANTTPANTTPANTTPFANASGFQLDGDTVLKAAAVFFGARYLLKGRRGRR